MKQFQEIRHLFQFQHKGKNVQKKIKLKNQAFKTPTGAEQNHQEKKNKFSKGLTFKISEE